MLYTKCNVNYKKLENNKLNGFSYNFMVTLDSITQKEKEKREK